MIRWEEEEGSWRGYSGTLVVATVTREEGDKEGGRWLWEMRAVKRLPGARASGHRTTDLEARRAVDSYWLRWLEAAALKPDLERLAAASLPKAKATRASRPRGV